MLLTSEWQGARAAWARLRGCAVARLRGVGMAQHPRRTPTKHDRHAGPTADAAVHVIVVRVILQSVPGGGHSCKWRIRTSRRTSHLVHVHDDARREEAVGEGGGEVVVGLVQRREAHRPLRRRLAHFVQGVCHGRWGCLLPRARVDCCGQPVASYESHEELRDYASILRLRIYLAITYLSCVESPSAWKNDKSRWVKVRIALTAHKGLRCHGRTRTKSMAR